MVDVGVNSRPSLLLRTPFSGLMISSLTLELKDGNVNVGIGIGSIVVHSRILVDNPSGFCVWWAGFPLRFGALKATGLAVEAPIGSTITHHVHSSRSISLKVCSALHLVLVLPWFFTQIKDRWIEHLPNNVPMTLWCTAAL